MSEFITYAQNNEDVILDAYFKDVAKGTYVDIGANHPVNDSITKHFYLKGWRGINVEPIKALYELLVQDRPEDINEQVGISNKSGKLTLREYANDGLSTFSSELQKEYTQNPIKEKTAAYVDVEVPVLTLKELFARHKVHHIHFMKVDVEGLEYEVLQGNDWKTYRPEMLCIEANHGIKGKDWRQILEKNHYNWVWNDGLNDYYLAQESAKRKNNFAFAETMLLGDQIIPHHVKAKIDEFSKQAQDAAINTEVRDLHIEQLKNEKQVLEAQLRDQQRLRNVLKLLARAVDNVIQARIERLHTTKIAPDRRPNGGNTFTFDDSSLKQLLESVREADIKAYYSNQTRRTAPSTFYAYHIAKGTYGAVRKVAGKTGRFAKRLLKKGRA